MIPIQENIQKLMGRECQNPSLRLYKYADPHGRLKGGEIKDFCDCVVNAKTIAKLSTDDFSLPKDIPGSQSFTAKAGGRLLVNHSGGLLENTNFCFHRLFGFPMIPGSALKGVARRAAKYALEEKEGTSDFEAEKKLMTRVFGPDKGNFDEDDSRAGSVVFLPAYPENDGWSVVPDVLTSHAKGDTSNPIPVFFPVVEEWAIFRFVILPTNRSKDGDVKYAVKYLKLALEDSGVGAKTTAGYGWFKDFKDEG